MIIISEKTKKQYNTIEECIAAEKEYDAKIQKEKEQRKMLEEQRSIRLAEIEAAYDEIIKARKKYSDLLDKYNVDYGYSIGSLKYLFM